MEDFPSIDAAAKDPQRQRSSHESTDGKRNLSDKRSLGNAGGRNNSIDHGGSDGELLGDAFVCAQSATGRCDNGTWLIGRTEMLCRVLQQLQG